LPLSAGGIENPKKFGVFSISVFNRLHQLFQIQKNLMGQVMGQNHGTYQS
jgi:hypothetical protein